MERLVAAHVNTRIFYTELPRNRNPRANCEELLEPETLQGMHKSN